jgi:hypothetical protein
LDLAHQCENHVRDNPSQETLIWMTRASDTDVNIKTRALQNKKKHTSSQRTFLPQDNRSFSTPCFQDWVQSTRMRGPTNSHLASQDRKKEEVWLFESLLPELAGRVEAGEA